MYCTQIDLDSIPLPKKGKNMYIDTKQFVKKES